MVNSGHMYTIYMLDSDLQLLQAFQEPSTGLPQCLVAVGGV